MNETEYRMLVIDTINALMPRIVEDVLTSVRADFEREAERQVLRAYETQVVAKNQELAETLTRVIALLAERSL